MLEVLKRFGVKIDTEINTERSELRRTSTELANAKEEEAKLEARLASLQAVITDADAADAAFKAAIAADDDGAALADFAQGTAPDGAIAKIVERRQTTAHAAVAARAAAPKVQSKLDELREQIKSFEYEKKQALLAYLRERAKPAYLEYDGPWAALCDAYDKIVGMRRALDTTTSQPIDGPRFGASPFRKMGVPSGSRDTAQTAARWRRRRTQGGKRRAIGSTPTRTRQSTT